MPRLQKGARAAKQLLSKLDLMKLRQFHFSTFSALLGAALVLCPLVARGDCSLTTTGNVPLPDLGPGSYQGFIGGLYPNGSNTRPPEHEAAGLAIAREIQPLNQLGNPDDINGKIVLTSIGMSSATQEWATDGPTSFKPRADADPSKNPKLEIVDGAQGGKDAISWANPKDDVWTVFDQRLKDANLTRAQVQVAWLHEAIAFPENFGRFPAHAQVLQANLEIMLRNLKAHCPNLRIVYLAARDRAYVQFPTVLSPEPYAYESGFGVQWTIADQINGAGNLNFDPARGAVVAPYTTWGPYQWADGTNPRSDGFIWECSDLQPEDFTHPSASGSGKIADQLLAFFKTDPTATPWFLKVPGDQNPLVTTGATPSTGTAGISIQFSASASEPGGTIASYQWTYDDGTFSTAQNPVKSFLAPGTYNVHLNVTDTAGNYVSTSVPITVGTGSLENVSTRGQVGSGDTLLIGGFIVSGAGTKKVIIRAVGPSLNQAGVSDSLADPTLELHDSGGSIIGTNDNWQTTQLGGIITQDQVAEIQASELAPSDPAESALIAELSPGAYTAIIRGANSESGVALEELYDLDQNAPARFANISTRGLVQTGDDVLIGGFIVGGPDSSTVLVRGLGPSLAQAGVADALADTTLDLHDNNGVLIQSNDNWADTQQSEIEATGVAPSDAREAAILQTLAPGNYTATVAGKNGGAGVGLVEIYKLQ
jgi:PKD repeat protein